MEINKRKQGITIALLVGTVVILLIIVSAITVSYANIKDTTNKREFAKEIYTIGTLLEKYRFEKGTYPEKGEFTLDLNSINGNSRDQFVNEPNYASNTILLSKLDLASMDVETVNRGVEKEGNTDIYAVSKSTGNIYYIQGEKIGDTVYYTLTDELKGLIAVETTSNDDIAQVNYVTDGLILQYDAINNTGNGHSNTTTTWKDLSGNGNDGSLLNFNYNTASGWNGSYLACDGVDDIIETIKELDYQNQKSVTVEFVVTNLNSKENTKMLIESSENSNDNYGSFYIDSQEYGIQDVTMAMKFNSSSGRLVNHKMMNNVLNFGETANYGITFDATKPYDTFTKMYKNGGANTLNTTSIAKSDHAGDVSNLTLQNYKLYLCGRGGTLTSHSKVNLYAVRVYNRALSPEEIQVNYQADKVKYGI